MPIDHPALGWSRNRLCLGTANGVVMRSGLLHSFLALLLGAVLVSCSSGGSDAATSISGAGSQIVVTPGVAALTVGESRLFTAKVTGAAQTAVTWSVVGTGTGSFTGASGLYTAPVTPGIYTIMASLASNPATVGTATVVVSMKARPRVLISPRVAEVGLGLNTSFLASITDAAGAPLPDQRVTWSVIGGANNGSFVGTTGLYTAPLYGGIFTVMATSQADPTAFDTATVTAVNLNPGIKVTVTPLRPQMRPGDTVAFEAKVEGSTNQEVRWGVVGGDANGTFVGNTGLYVAPQTPGIYTITATSLADPARIATATVLVDSSVNITVAVTPKNPPPIVPGATIAFNAVVEGTTNKAVKWTVVGGEASGVFAGSTGLYVAPVNPGTYTVMAASVADPGKFDTGQVVVSTASLPVEVTIAPATVSITPGAVFTFTATVTGSYNTTVTWSIDSGNGSINKTLGIFTAPMQPGVSVVRATSALNPTKYATATVTVTQAKVVITPAGPQQMVSAESRMFTGVVNDLNGTAISDQRIDWQMVSPTLGTAFRTTSPYWFTAPPTPGPVVLRATSVMDPTAFQDVPIAVQSYLLNVTPKYALVSLARFQQFICDPTDVIWSVQEGGAGGTISTTGLYLAPQPASAAGGLGSGLLAFGLDYVVASSKLDNRIITTVPVQISPVLVTPERASLSPGQTLQFSGLVMGTPNPNAVSWTAYFIPAPGQDPVDSGGAMAASGLFTAPITKGIYRVRATATASPVVYGEAEIQVQ